MFFILGWIYVVKCSYWINVKCLNKLKIKCVILFFWVKCKGEVISVCGYINV